MKGHVRDEFILRNFYIFLQICCNLLWLLLLKISCVCRKLRVKHVEEAYEKVLTSEQKSLVIPVSIATPKNVSRDMYRTAPKTEFKCWISHCTWLRWKGKCEWWNVMDILWIVYKAYPAVNKNWPTTGIIQFPRFGGSNNANVVILRDFLFLVHCLGWCHIMTPERCCWMSRWVYWVEDAIDSSLIHLSHEKALLLSIESWLFKRDLYSGLS